MKIVRTSGEINLLIDACVDAQNTNTTEFSNLTYEDGILRALRWLTSSATEYPLFAYESVEPDDEDEYMDDGEDDDFHEGNYDDSWED